ncbi:FAD/NAD(P)-binding domain-containing protein [Phaeosphaeriaceae sp. SRC1lsM3a]|nr:FAD/NAD(P)-binding domain-containing protein [Stagonospora sp. SRC1lsM3a]
MHVLISGAGIAGPTLAWFLEKSGAQVTVLEKSVALLPHGQSVDIQGSAVEIIRRMGLLDEVRRRNTTEKGSQFIGPNGLPFASFLLTEGSAASPTSPFEILRGDLAGILYEATKDRSGVRYLFNTTIKDVVDNGNESVTVELSNGEKQVYDLLVAADGQWSRVRQQCFPPASVQVRNMGMYTVYYTVPHVPNDNQMWNIFVSLNSRIVATRPDPHGTTRAMFTIMPRSAAQAQRWKEASRKSRKTQSELLREEFADAGWQSQRLLDAMDAAPDFYFQVIEQIKMSTWSKERVICLGDTAYAPSPLTGMGTSLAIVGAYLLAGELSKLKTGEHPSKAFATYEEKFRPFVEESQSVPSFIPAIMHPEKPWKRWILHGVISAIAWVVAIPFVARKLGDPTSVEDFPLPHYSKLDGSSCKTDG